MTVAYIKNKNIDKKKWDCCINNAANKLIYAQSFFLDIMAVNWDGIVLGDYEAIMPLTWKSKWGIRYLYQPAFLQQGGIFFKIALNDETIQQFFKIVLTSFKFAEVTGNYLNASLQQLPFLKTNSCNNFIINLKQSYAAIYTNYSFSCKKSLKRIKKFRLQYQLSDDFASIIQLYKKLYGKRLPHILNRDYTNFKKLCIGLTPQQNLITRQVYTAKDELLCAVILLKDDNRLYNIISCITDAGKKLEANYFLYDHIFQEFSEQELIFDFEGSDITGIANFYSKFNPENQPYLFIKYNNLNPFFKLFKQ